jgi:hypothetical protein
MLGSTHTLPFLQQHPSVKQVECLGVHTIIFVVDPSVRQIEFSVLLL